MMSKLQISNGKHFQKKQLPAMALRPFYTLNSLLVSTLSSDNNSVKDLHSLLISHRKDLKYVGFDLMIGGPLRVSAQLELLIIFPTCPLFFGLTVHYGD